MGTMVDGADLGANGPAVPPPGGAGGPAKPRHQHLKRLAALLARPVPHRPIWQRVLYPIIGLCCLVLAILGWLLPILPGWLFFVPAVLMLPALHRGLERRTRCVLRSLLRRLMRKRREPPR